MVEEHDLVGIEAAGDQPRRHLADVAAKLVRLDEHGDGVEVGEEEEAFGAAVLELRPRLDRAEIVAEVEVAGGLDPRKHAHRHLPQTGFLRRSRIRMSSRFIAPMIQATAK
jgi:hypothetical protein